MNKTELVAAIAAKTGSTKKDADAMIGAFVDVVGDAMKKGEKVQLVGFGTFDVVKHKARTGRNPRTGEDIKISARTSPKFTPGKALKEKVAKAKKK